MMRSDMRRSGVTGLASVLLAASTVVLLVAGFLRAEGQPGGATAGPAVVREVVTENYRVRLDLQPQVLKTVEPLPSCYLRRALAYRFVREVLVDAFGEDALSQMHRLTADGPVEQTLAEELRAIEALFHGAYSLSCAQIGMGPHTTPIVGSADGPQADAARFDQWRANLAADPDVAQDARMMVPVFYDIDRKQTKVWVFLGWTSRSLDVSFRAQPRATVLDLAGQPVAPERLPELRFESQWCPVASPVLAEVYVTEILDRDQFRSLCDEHQTRSAILAQLR